MSKRNSLKKEIGRKTQIVLVGLMLILGLVFSGCEKIREQPINIENSSDINSEDEININSSLRAVNDDLKVFENKEELVKYLQEKESNIDFTSSSGGFDTRDGVVMMDSMAVAESFDGASMPNSVTKSSSEQTSDYSKTNVQVKGVDEADIVKNDGKYIYTLSQNKVIVVDAYPGENINVVSSLKFDEDVNLRNLFINEDKLVVFANEYKRITKVSEYDFVPRETRKEFTHIYIYDMKNRNEIKLLKDYSVSGNFDDARMIGDIVYVISNEYTNIYRGDIDIPVLYDSDLKIANPQIYYFNVPYNSYNFHTVSSFDLNSLEEIDSKSFMLGYGTTLYISENNIYISYNKYYSNDRIGDFKTIVYPLLSSNVQKEINKILANSEVSENIKFDKIVEVLEVMYNNMEEKAKNSLIEKINEKQINYNEEKAASRENTVVHKISIDEGKIEYETKAEVKGHLLNQFSLDEFDSNLRLATTTSYWSSKDRQRVQYNNVYVLDEKMKQVGKIEELAEDERIYSTRFMGDKLYMVTFKQVDPLFVIDLSNPSKPEVLGELKIPGFSDYLHPFGKNHLIGVGKDTKESEWGGIITTGVKLSLFDVSDFSNPKEVDNYVIKGRWSDSAALHEHKAFLFDEEKELLVLPVREYLGGEDNYDYRYSQGAYVFTLNTKGFDLRGIVTHEDDEQGSSYWYNSPNSVVRSLYMDNVLYTVSQKKILANDMVSIDAVGEVDLGYVDVDYRDDYIYY